MPGKRTTPAGKIALGGVLAALAVAIMGIGTLFSTFVYLCPIVCMALTGVVCLICGSRMAWAWYGAVTLLSAMMAPDKEAAVVFLFFGYYPIVKPGLDGKRLGILWKVLLFNSSAVVMTWLLAKLLGIQLVEEEYRHIRQILLAALLILGNVTFFLADILVGRIQRILAKMIR